ncbi:sugar ABC transporter permease [bacterium]|nr:sugar ABC transporter permease [bacterium]
MTASERRDLRNGLLFTSPWILGATVFLVGPILFSLYASFCDYSVLRRPEWIGLSNYTDLMSDEVFWKALANTLVFASLSIPIGLVVSLGLAFLLNTGVRGMTVFRTIFFLPSLVPMVALAIIWLWIFNGENGVLNYFVTSAFGLLGLKVTPPGWLTDPAWSKPALVMMSAWTVGHAIVIYLASLQDVPVHLYEAAELDGASYLQRLRYVTIPSISPVILFNLIMGIIGTLQTFAVPYVISPSGAPARSIYFLAMYLYDNAFPYLRMGYACAMAWILFILILLLTLLALKVSSRHVHYGGM